MGKLPSSRELELERVLVGEHRTWLSIQGDRVTIRETEYHPVGPNNGRRGVIHSFSARSRSRMLRRLSEIRWADVGPTLFCTVTYPPSCENHTMRERSVHRYLFHRFVEKHFGRKVGSVWRVEWKVRQSGVTKGCIAPHIHWMFFGMRFISKRLVSQTWGAIVGAPDGAVVDVQRCDAQKMIGIYIAKYCAKESDSLLLDNVPYHNKTGRHAGWLRLRQIPMHPESTIEVRDEALIAWLRERAREFRPQFDPYHSGGVTVLGENGKVFAKEIGEIMLDMEPKGP